MMVDGEPCVCFSHNLLMLRSGSPSEETLVVSPVTATSHNTLIESRVRAMTVDDSTGLWKTIKGNPSAVLKLIKEGDDTYIITAQRQSDRQEQLYSSKLTPTTIYQRGHGAFHHWKTEYQRQGVVFNSQGDARRFERLVRKAISDISPQRCSSSEEEIFVKPDTLLLDCEPTVSPLSVGGAPLRPHKPKRLTEEYRANSSVSSEGDKFPSSLSSASQSPNRELINPGASTVLSVSAATGSCATGSCPTSTSNTAVTAASTTTTTAAAAVRSLYTTAVSAPAEHNQPVITESSRVFQTQATTTSAKPTISSSQSTTLTSTKQKSMEAAPRAAVNAPKALRNQYSDYRNDYYIKSDKRVHDVKQVTVSASQVEVQSQNRTADESVDSNLKAIKNTPPLPRKKKRHRGGLKLCCFSTDASHDSSDEAV